MQRIGAFIHSMAALRCNNCGKDLYLYNPVVNMCKIATRFFRLKKANFVNA